METAKSVLSWLHIGDLHITSAGQPNEQDLRRIVTLVNGAADGGLDFAVLPGDNADDGTPEQFSLVRNAVAPLRLPLHILPGDHDFTSGDLNAFHEVLGAPRLPYAVTQQGHRCLFLDVVSAGTGGPDFRLEAAQIDWVERELTEAVAVGQDAVVFMHTYPADLREGAERLGALLRQPHVVCVDMGHTHYNELANDGGTVFMVTRSTGQIEEGPPGFSIAAVDAGCASWRFKPLEKSWPFVLVTQPVDRRLARDRNPPAQASFAVRAKVLGDAPITLVEVQVNGGYWAAMVPQPGNGCIWQAICTGPAELIRVRARDNRGRADEDVIEPTSPGWRPPVRTADGSDRDRVGAWPLKGIRGTQLGPNRNGRKW